MNAVYFEIYTSCLLFSAIAEISQSYQETRKFKDYSIEELDALNRNSIWQENLLSQFTLPFDDCRGLSQLTFFFFFIQWSCMRKIVFNKKLSFLHLRHLEVGIRGLKIIYMFSSSSNNSCIDWIIIFRPGNTNHLSIWTIIVWVFPITCFLIMSSHKWVKIYWLYWS